MPPALLICHSGAICEYPSLVMTMYKHVEFRIRYCWISSIIPVLQNSIPPGLLQMHAENSHNSCSTRQKSTPDDVTLLALWFEAHRHQSEIRWQWWKQHPCRAYPLQVVRDQDTVHRGDCSGLSKCDRFIFHETIWKMGVLCCENVFSAGSDTETEGYVGCILSVAQVSKRHTRAHWGFWSSRSLSR